ncbi:MAG: hypothetical protein JWL76_169 [Thermoleophilia bacterium]|nr:hypothetical protein [Thermoleophilia bacterium]
MQLGHITLGTVLFTNAPNGVLIKPLPIEFTAGSVLGPARGWSSLGDAVAAVAALTAGDRGAAAIVRDGARFVAHTLTSSWFGEPDVALTSPVRNFGGRPTVHPSVVAFVDGPWVERVTR